MREKVQNDCSVCAPVCVYLGDTRTVDAGGAHLCQYFIQPLEGAIEVQLNPTRGAGYGLSPEGRREREINENVFIFCIKQQHSKPA